LGQGCRMNKKVPENMIPELVSSSTSLTNQQESLSSCRKMMMSSGG
jgi:hypothetical protein